MDIELFKRWCLELPEVERTCSAQNETFKIRSKIFAIVGQDYITVKCLDSHNFQTAIQNPDIVPAKSMHGRNWITITNFHNFLIEDLADFIVYSYETVVRTFAKAVREKLLKNIKHDIDSPWKDILSLFFREFIEFFDPGIANEIDWTKTPVFLDKELSKIIKKSETGKRYVDKLVKLWRINGQETWVLLHIEVQSQVQQDFPERMFIYSNRLKDIYRKPIASIAILTDDDPKWRPFEYNEELWKSKKKFEFPVIKLLDYQRKWKQLEKSDNPFAFVVMAHLKMLETKNDDLNRLHWKVTLTKMLHEKGFTDDRIEALFKFIDWLLTLPVAMTMTFEETISKFNEEGKMRYITSMELYERRKFLNEGRNEILNKLKNVMPKDQYDKWVQPLQTELQALTLKPAFVHQ